MNGGCEWVLQLVERYGEMKPSYFEFMPLRREVDVDRGLRSVV